MEQTFFHINVLKKDDLNDKLESVITKATAMQKSISITQLTKFTNFSVF